MSEAVCRQGVCVFLDWCCPRAAGKARVQGWVSAHPTSQEHKRHRGGRSLEDFLFRMQFFQFQFCVINEYIPSQLIVLLLSFSTPDCS